MSDNSSNSRPRPESGFSARFQSGYVSSVSSDDLPTDGYLIDQTSVEAEQPEAVHKILRDGPTGYRARVPESIRGSEVRKIRRRSYDGYTTDVPMTCLNFKVVSAESLLEADFLIVTDAFGDDIKDVTAQPLTFDLSAFGLTVWTPDFRIDRKTGGKELIEVKTLDEARPKPKSDDAKAVAEAEAKAAKFALREAAWRQVSAAHGFTFRLVTEDEIRIQPMLDNARLVQRHLHPFLDRPLLLRAIVALPTLGDNPTISDLAVAIDGFGRAIEIAIRLDRLTHIRLDRSVHFGLTTTFTVLRGGV